MTDYIPKQPAMRRIKNFRKNILAWFSTEGRDFPWRHAGEPIYRIIISEVLLQRTKATTVANIYFNFFKKYSSWNKLAAATVEDLEEFLRPLGLWRRRAISLLNLARVVVQRNGHLPQTRSEIEELPGVGQYIANAIELMCGINAAPLLDVNMVRVLERYFGPRTMADIRYDPYLQKLAWRVVDCDFSIQLSWAILDLAAMVCIAREPRCKGCPLSYGCNFVRNVSIASGMSQS